MKKYEQPSFMQEAEGKKPNISGIIKEVIDTGWSGSNESQMKILQLMKGIATSDEAVSNKFMKAIDTFTSSLKAEDYK